MSFLSEETKEKIRKNFKEMDATPFVISIHPTLYESLKKDGLLKSWRELR